MILDQVELITIYFIVFLLSLLSLSLLYLDWYTRFAAKSKFFSLHFDIPYSIVILRYVQYPYICYTCIIQNHSQ